MIICTLSLLVNIGNQCNTVEVKKCGCVGSWSLFLLLLMILVYHFIGYRGFALLL